MKRSSGIMMPLSSLPSPYGIGTMGKEAYRFVDFLKSAGQRWWQLLPLGPTAYADSPYASPSTYAGNPYFIDLDTLCKEGLLLKSEYENRLWGDKPDAVDYGAIFENRFAVLRLAYERGKDPLKKELAAFRKANSAWLEDYALFMSIKAENGMVSWTEWPEELRRRKPSAMKACRSRMKEEISFWCFTQYLFFRQWNSLRDYAHRSGIGFIGDIPIYVALDSADVWSEPEYFKLDEELKPTEVSGCPPDDFTADGQLWGNPLYDYEKMERDGYDWWLRRIDGIRKLYDVIRIDHFRGFESYWAVPYGDPTARRGCWRKGPDIGLVGKLLKTYPDTEFIAEDLGFTTPEVEKLLADSGLPGMKVLQFGFDSNGDSSHAPHNITKNSCCYIGTHDNHTVLGWLDSLPEEGRAYTAEYLALREGDSWCKALIRTGMATTANLFVATAQDILEKGPECRMNTPGIPQGNWRWRMLPGELKPENAAWLRQMTETYRRLQA